MRPIKIELNEAQWATVVMNLHHSIAHHAANQATDQVGRKRTEVDAPYYKIKRAQNVLDRIEKQLRAARPVEERDRA